MSTNYIEKVKKIRTSDLIGYWPLNDESGTVALDVGPSGFNGLSASLVRLPSTRGFTSPDGGRCAQFDGSASLVNLTNTWTSTIAVAEGSVQAWVATPSSGLGGTSKAQVVILAADTANEIGIHFDTTANRFACNYSAGSGDATYSTTYGKLVYNDYWSPGVPTWHSLLMTYSAAADAVVLYVDGTASTACASLGAWTGAFASTATNIASTSSTLATGFTGYISHVAWWKTPLTGAEAEELAKAGP